MNFINETLRYSYNSKINDRDLVSIYGFRGCLFKNQIFLIRMIMTKLMSPCKDFGNINSIVCRMLDFFKDIIFCFKSNCVIVYKWS